MHAAHVEKDVIALVPVERASVVLSRLLVVLFVSLVACLAMVPWQQTSIGKGRVIAYAPVERQQSIDAPVEGRIVRWYVHEGSKVAAGDPIVDITDNDPEILTRLRAEREAVRARMAAAQVRVAAIGKRIEAMRQSQKAAVMAADHRTTMGEGRLRAAEHALEAAEAASKVARLNDERQKALFEQGLTSKRSVELAEADAVRTRTDAERAAATLAAARAEVAALSADQGKVDTDAFASISDAEAARASADAEIASNQAEMARIEVRVARQETQHVKAPSAGTVLRVIARHGSDIVKTGDVIAQFVPDTTDRAVEVWVDGNDVNLIQPGRLARLQFEGWPAVQFSGWPSAAVGTYGGRVAFVDPTDDGQGHFRVVVIPDQEVAWPDPAMLRQGTRAYGWVLLGRVTLGRELWRLFNGFPPEWTGAPSKGEGKGDAGGEKGK